MIRPPHRALLLLAALVIAPVVCAAQTQCLFAGLNGNCTINVPTSLTINRILRLTIDDSSTTVVPPTVADYNAGFQQFSALNVTVKANDTWALSIRGTTATWTATGGARATKPVGDLRWASSSGGPYTAATTTNAQIRTGPAGASTVTPMFYQIFWAYPVDTPGTYTMTVIYTLTSP